ncbi:hypothetical protein [Roseospira navarrensis]|uniref:Uncharacterized protein n=1 Tax=Roseospira navarrensis TaxID=140058 RepID=A0A7X2D197_9PROT|nr:hypothetical protein [Roseospira navarrensis]MQX34899.1 hypothetical protein [Roseospira navarrensis]
MITIQDCLGLTDATPDEVVVIACHEHLPPILAASKAYALLGDPSGAAAMRRMILDEYCRAVLRRDRARCERLAALFQTSLEAHPAAGGEPASPGAVQLEGRTGPRHGRSAVHKGARSIAWH